MKAKQLFRKTMPFCIAKLLLGGATVLILSLLLALFAGVGWIFGDTGLVIGFLIWMGSIGVVRFFIMHYVGYLVKAGHLAVLAQATITGKVPRDQVKYGINKVKERFATANIYFAIDKLVTGAVKQIQRGIEKLSNSLSFVPGMEHIASLAKFFVELSLGYIDECCLSYTFLKVKQNAYKSACDGVVLYAQNIKLLLKNAAKTMLKVVFLTVAAVLIIFIPVGLLFRLMHWHGFIAFVLACLIAWVVKFAFLDSFILCQTMAAYLDAAKETKISFDLYGKLSGISSSFKELFEKGRGEMRRPAQSPDAPDTEPAPDAYDAGGQPPPPARPRPEMRSASRPVPQHKFCGQCGAKNDGSAAFCQECGEKL